MFRDALCLAIDAVLSSQYIDAKQDLRAPKRVGMLPACPHLPPRPKPGLDWRTLNAFGEGDRGERFYDACLEYAHSLWQRKYAARAILCLDRAMGADLTGYEPILEAWPMPYSAMVWFMKHPPRGLHRQSPDSLPALRGSGQRAAQGGSPMEGMGVLGSLEKGDAAPAGGSAAHRRGAYNSANRVALAPARLPGRGRPLALRVPAPHGVREHGAVGETRTRDRRFRKPLLYPAELPPLMIEQQDDTIAGTQVKSLTVCRFLESRSSEALDDNPGADKPDHQTGIASSLFAERSCLLEQDEQRERRNPPQIHDAADEEEHH